MREKSHYKKYACMTFARNTKIQLTNKILETINFNEKKFKDGLISTTIAEISIVVNVLRT